jgi:hypothetical protein
LPDSNASGWKRAVWVVYTVFCDRAWKRLICESKLQSMDPQPKNGVEETKETAWRSGGGSKKYLMR